MTSTPDSTTTDFSIRADSFLTLHYRMSSLAGVDIINTFNDKPATLTLGTGQLSPLLEGKLIGLCEGAKATFEVAGAFGERNPEVIQWVARSLLQTLGERDSTYAVGDVVQFPTPNGQATYAGAVQEVSTDAVKFDFNHPLAGQVVAFEVHILSVL